MALTVEDGTVIDGADSYVTVTFADTYHQGRGNTSWFTSSGVMSGNVTVSAATVVGTSTLTLATDATGAFLFRAGDILNIGGAQYTVTSTTSAVGASTTGSVSVTPPVQSALSGGEAVTIHETLKEVALRYATRYADDNYQWLGVRSSNDSSITRLDWPRASVYTAEGYYVASDSIPEAVKQFVCEMAIAHLDSVLNEVRERGGMVLAHGVGPLFQQFSKGAPAGRTFPYADSLIAHLTTGSRLQPYLSRG